MGFSKENQLWLEFISGESGMRWCVKRTREKHKWVDGLAVCSVTRKCSPDESPENHWMVLVEEKTYAQHHLTVQFTDMRSCSGVVCIFIANCATFLLFMIPRMLVLLFLLPFAAFGIFPLFSCLYSPFPFAIFDCLCNLDEFDDYN